MFIFWIFSVPPRFANISGNRYFHANGVNVLDLTCQTDDSNPPANISWYINGHPIPSTNLTTEEVGQYGGKHTSQILALKPTRFMDKDKVECRVHNSEFRDNVELDFTNLDLMCKCFTYSLVQYTHVVNTTYKNIAHRLPNLLFNVEVEPT